MPGEMVFNMFCRGLKVNIPRKKKANVGFELSTTQGRIRRPANWARRLTGCWVLIYHVRRFSNAFSRGLKVNISLKERGSMRFELVTMRGRAPRPINSARRLIEHWVSIFRARRLSMCFPGV